MWIFIYELLFCTISFVIYIKEFRYISGFVSAGLLLQASHHPTVPTAPPMRLPIPNPNPKTHPNPNPIFNPNPNPFFERKQRLHRNIGQHRVICTAVRSVTLNLANFSEVAK